MNCRFLLLINLFIFSTFFSMAQSYRAEASLDTNKIMIGDHLNVRLQVNVSPKVGVIIPQLTPEILSEYGIDRIASGSVDTIQDANSITYQQTITITAFDEGTLYFPSIPILSIDSMLLSRTDSLAFQVLSLPVDTTTDFMDIKPIERVPLTFKEVLPFILLGLLGIVVIILIVIFILTFIKKKNRPTLFLQAKPKGKPEEIALRALEELRLRCLWQNGKVKQYYSELSTIIRVYIEDRYGINAMEMVSDEILGSISAKITTEAFNALRDLLQISDLVKFAKYSPLPNDHDRCLKEAIEFVKLTTPVVSAPEEQNGVSSNNQNHLEKEQTL